jgi:hypothetical protein
VVLVPVRAAALSQYGENTKIAKFLELFPS